MRTNNHSTKVSQSLQEDLAAYGLTRMEAAEKAPVKADGDPTFFGIKNYGDKTKLSFNTSIEAIQKKQMTVAMTAPELDSFDMLATEDFKSTTARMSKDDLRNFLRDLIDRV